MKIRYGKILLEADEGITFEVSEGVDGKLIIRAIDSKNSYSNNYTTPPIMRGYTHARGEWNTGFIIKRESDGSEFIWVPVGFLESDGTLDGKRYCEKFGKRNNSNKDFLSNNYQALEGSLLEQYESVKKYGGYYISLYHISKGPSERPVSRAENTPWIEIDFHEANNLASIMENTEEVKSHLIWGIEFDCLKKMMEKSVAFANNFKIENVPNEEWTQDKVMWCQRIIRKCKLLNTSEGYHFGAEDSCPCDEYSKEIGFRVALCIK